MQTTPLSAAEQAAISAIEHVYYMRPPLALLDKFVRQHKKPRAAAVLAAFDHIHDFMQQGRAEVDLLLQQRVANGEISDKKQAGKSIAGAMFPNLIRFLFLKNKESGAIPAHVCITHKQAAIKRFGEDFTVYVDGERQTPSFELAIYNSDNQKIIILSIKTSLRERAGQTYEWKLLLEIVQSGNALQKKYNIRYNGENAPLVCFATADFYNEINNPQQQGILKFFHQAFIAKPGVTSDFVCNLSELPEFIRRTIA